MGIEASQLGSYDIDVDEKEKEICDYWSHHTGTVFEADAVTRLSVFVAESQASGGTYWSSEVPLHKNAKNLMVYRHPCITKYISSWQKASKFYLAVEEVAPLSHILPSLTDLQVSIGLHSVLKALCFLHETASVSHNNVCVSSVYITKDGDWKLGAMEYLCKYSELTVEYLSKSRPYRYGKAIDGDEARALRSGRKESVDVYAFGAFAKDVLKSKEGNDVAVLEFCRYCEGELQNPDPSKRPAFRDILAHPFFDQDFIRIHSFLVELPLKNDTEKKEFFRTLGERLRKFDGGLVANQLGGLLLSRLVLLNGTAQNEVVPLMLSPRVGTERDGLVPLFSQETFKRFLCPKVIEIFKVRDIQIRLLLLDHFHNFMHVFTKDELKLHILPELLVGIKDTNDELVSATLRSLADLVSVLGSEAVIGGKRAKLFNDGRPTQPYKTKKISRTANATGFVGAELPERPRPDGGEGETSTEEVEHSADDEDLENWDDWDTTNEGNVGEEKAAMLESDQELDVPTDQSSVQVSQPTDPLPAIQSLDIKSNVVASNSEEIDFFQDMEPVITQSSKFIIEEGGSAQNSDVSSKFKMEGDTVDDDGWENSGWE